MRYTTNSIKNDGSFLNKKPAGGKNVVEILGEMILTADAHFHTLVNISLYNVTCSGDWIEAEGDLSVHIFCACPSAYICLASGAISPDYDPILCFSGNLKAR